MADGRQIPALLDHRLTPVYDVFARAFLREGRLKREIIARARIGPRHRVLDLGSGTGTLALMVKRAHPDAEVVGLDGDPAAVAIAVQKASRAGMAVGFETGKGTALRYADSTFDRVLSSLVMSVLTTEQKRSAIREAHRVLRPGGLLVIGDFARPHTPWGRFVAPLVRRFEPIGGNLDGLLPRILGDAGFDDVGEAGRIATPFGTLSVVSGRRPD